MGFVGQVFEVERIHGAFQADVKLIDQSIAHGFNRYTEKYHFLEEVGGVSLIAADPAQVLGNHAFEFPIQSGDQKRANTRAVSKMGARYAFIKKYISNVIALCAAIFAAATDLVLCAGFLFVGRVAGVDCYMH